MLNVRPVGPALRVEVVGDAAALAPDIEAEVDRIWQIECARSPSLFDGPLFGIRSIEGDLIRGEMTTYRRFVAQRRRSGFGNQVLVRPLGVTGLHFCADGVVFCRRGQDVEMDAGLWELSPAGSVDGRLRTADGAVDLRAQLLEELVQETGLDSAIVLEEPRPFALVEDQESLVTDIGLLIRTNAGERAIHQYFETRGTREYEAIAVVPVAQLGTFAREVGLAPVSSALIAAAAPLLGA